MTPDKNKLIRKRAPVEVIGMINKREMIERVQVQINIVTGGMIIQKMKRDLILDVNNYQREI